MSDTPNTDAPNTDAPTTSKPKVKRTRKPSASKSGAFTSSQMTAARKSTSGATLARAFTMEGKRVRDIARRIGFYASDPSRTLKKYLDNGAPSFGKARADIIAAVVKAHSSK